MLCLYLWMLLLARSADCVDERKDFNEIYKKLREDLKKDYDRNARPVVYNSNVTKVQIAMHLASTFEIDEEAQTIDIDSYMSMGWADQHLSWNPANYEDIRVIQISPKDIWMPDIYEMQSGGPTSDMQQADFNFIMLENRGIVHWLLATVLPGRCTFDYSNYPTDAAKCEIVLEMWSFKGDTVDVDAILLDYGKDDTSPKHFNSQWELTDISAKRVVWTSKCCGFYPSARFTINVIRKTPTLQQQLMWVASVVVILLTLGMFWIPSDIEQKMTVGCVVMVIMIAVLLTVASSVRARQPMMIIAGTIHNIMFVAIAAILLEIIAINLQHIQEWEPPEFLLNILSGTVGRILLISSAQQERPSLDKMKLSEYESGEVMLEQLTTLGNWKTISQALDRIAFLMYIIILSAIPKT